LIIWIGNHQPTPFEYAVIERPALAATIGLPISAPNDAPGFAWLNTQLAPKSLYELDMGSSNTMVFKLTMAGWEKHELLKKRNFESCTAFMAMKFDQPDLNRVVDACFRPAVHRTGFELQVLTDKQPAGIIDDQMRAAILSSRFVIADLTHRSPGAYWEAGFAEGLGLPVIYTCEKGLWEKEQTHFDTNHLVTRTWELANLKKAEDALVATIRATLRAEAKQTDE
jgi:hypothetical protein